MMDKSFQDSLETIEKFDRLQIVGTLFDNIILSIACVRDSMGSYMEMDNVIADVDPYFCAICFVISCSGEHSITGCFSSRWHLSMSCSVREDAHPFPQ